MNAIPLMRRLSLVLGLSTVFAGGVAPLHAADVVTAADDSGGNTWKSIENDNYDRRDHFAKGASRLSARLDDQIRLLRTKRAAMTTDTKDWDLAMKAVDEARTLLAGRITELGRKNTPETWIAAKENIGDAWKQSQTAVDKMNATVTS